MSQVDFAVRFERVVVPDGPTFIRLTFIQLPLEVSVLVPESNAQEFLDGFTAQFLAAMAPPTPKLAVPKLSLVRP